MDKKICFGRGVDIPHADFMRLINVSFNHGEDAEDYFLTLLPKLYREEYRPQDQNYVVTEDGLPVAAVGAYDHELCVCGRTLACRGIGNVAVHPEHRSKGYMNTAMDAAMKDMISDGVVLSALSGRRQRYRYFGYDNTGLKYTYSISRENIHHTFGDLSSPYSVREITDPADSVIDSIASLSRRAPAAPIRERSRYLDIARSWHSRLLAILDGERFVGYCILDRGNSVSEIEVADERELSGCVRTLFASLGEGYSITLPPDRVGYRRELDMLAEKVTLTTACNFNVLNYRAVIDAFLSLKLSYSTLPEGEMTLLIHGYAGDERVRIVLRDGRALVEYVDRSTPIDCELGHAEALSLIFSPMSAAREQASELARLWFPLPLYIPRADKV